jgi:hypothetical protein
MTTDVATKAKPKRGYFLPGAIALAALLLIGLYVGAGDLQHPGARTLVGPAIADQIALSIQIEQAAARAPAISCPPEEPVRQGLKFTCTLGGAAHKTLYVTEIDGRGQVRWSLTP